MHWLGIDGGGTKTSFTLYDDGLHACNRFVLPTCHYAQAGLQGMREVLKEGIERARRGADRADGLGLGFSICGFGEDAAADRAIAQAASDLSGEDPHVLVNDVEAAWAAGLGMCDGIALIAGTGSIALGVRGDERLRCGGWDYELGDEGSGGWMGKELLRAFTRQADGRDRRGPLYDLVRDELHLRDDFEVIARGRQILPDRTRTAALSKLVTRAARLGDESAMDIFARAASEEADMVRAVVDGLFSDMAHMRAQVPVTYMGGTFNAKDLVLGPLTRALPRCCRLVAPEREPDLGAVLILQRRLGIR